MTKPLIRKVAGVWHCGMRGDRGQDLGVGYTPAEAYADYFKIKEKRCA